MKRTIKILSLIPLITFLISCVRNNPEITNPYYVQADFDGKTILFNRGPNGLISFSPIPVPQYYLNMNATSTFSTIVLQIENPIPFKLDSTYLFNSYNVGILYTSPPITLNRDSTWYTFNFGVPNPKTSFSCTITYLDSSFVKGTFFGTIYEYNGSSHYKNITNGKFFIPLSPRLH